MSLLLLSYFLQLQVLLLIFITSSSTPINIVEVEGVTLLKKKSSSSATGLGPHHLTSNNVAACLGEIREGTGSDSPLTG